MSKQKNWDLELGLDDSKIYLIVHDMIHNAYLEQLVLGNWFTGVLNNPLVFIVSSLILANYSSRQTKQVGGGG